jgi:dTDP-4-amino-4,6-dideoxygalactose transaminase
MSRDAWKRFDANGSWYYEVVLPGFKYNMMDIQAAMGIHQLDRLGAFQQRRRAIVETYQQELGSLDCLQLPVERPEAESSWHLYILRLNLERLTIDRSRFIDELRALNIGTSVHYLPVHMHPFYSNKYGYRPDDIPVAARAYARMLTIPLHPGLTDQDVADVISAIRLVAARYRL